MVDVIFQLPVQLEEIEARTLVAGFSVRLQKHQLVKRNVSRKPRIRAVPYPRLLAASLLLDTLLALVAIQNAPESKKLETVRGMFVVLTAGTGARRCSAFCS